MKKIPSELIMQFIEAGEVELLRELLNWTEYIENVYDPANNDYTKLESAQIADDSYEVIKERRQNGEYKN